MRRLIAAILLCVASGWVVPADARSPRTGLVTIRCGKSPIQVAAHAVPNFQALCDELAAGGFVKFAGGFRHGHCAVANRHACGEAIDINQTARAVVTKRFPADINAIARRHGILHGGEWRNSDYGHFELLGRIGRAKVAKAPEFTLASADPHEPIGPISSAPAPQYKSLIDGLAAEIAAAVTPRTAIYDISARVVILPSGERLEAHSGLGRYRDDPKYAAMKFRGPTPPNVYQLAALPRLFYGVRALRMNPVDEKRMRGRNGILAHSYLHGKTGDSQGCMAVKDYKRFLQAFQRGEIDRVVVVARI